MKFGQNSNQKSDQITDIRAIEILDNRGNPTIRCYVTIDHRFTGIADVPSGSSTGSFEAKELRDGEKRYNGMGVKTAIGHIENIIKPALIGVHGANQRNIDYLLNKLDGTKDKSKLGGNAILAVSLAVAKAAAKWCHLPLYRYLNTNAHVLPVPQACLINGGLHAGNDLDIQEYCVMPVGAASFTHAVQILSEIFKELGRILLKTMGKNATNSSEDGGFAPPLDNSFAAMEILSQAVKNCGYENEVEFGLDLAASGLLSEDGKTYEFEGKRLTSREMIDYIKDLVRQFPKIVSIEDPLDEKDYKGWIAITREMSDKMIIGDDIFATNIDRIKMGVEKKIANSILCKVNQIGTITEATDAAMMAQSNSYPVVMSVRSGETEDSVLSDISCALNAGLFKTGGIRGSDRGTNYNRFIEIEHELGPLARYAGRNYKGTLI
jgi:enolase